MIKVPNMIIIFAEVLPESVYRTVKYAKTIPFWKWF